MACDEHLAERVRDVVNQRPGVAERKMFGGLGWMACGVMTEGLVVRIAPEETEEADLARWVHAGADRAASMPPK